MPKMIKLIGSCFNGCKVLERCENIQGRVAYNCKCYCGSHFKATAKVIRSGAKRSCGCARKGINKTHGMSGTAEYRSWSGMIQRCKNIKNPKYKDYGGRGITVCNEWLDFNIFIKDMGKMKNKGMSIGRMDNDKPYCKENCRWETSYQQADNTRRTRRFDYRGMKLTAREVCCINGLDYDLVYSRLFRGCTDDEVDSGGALHHKFVYVNGKRMNTIKAIELLKIPVSTFYKRRRLGAESQKIIDFAVEHGYV